MIGVVIVNWNGRNLLSNCLASLQEQRCQHLACVVDNGSADGSASMVQRDFPWVHTVLLQENVGYAAGANRGIAAVSALKEIESILLLNNDTVLADHCLEELTVAARRFPEFGMFACCMVRHADPNIIDSAGLHLFPTGNVSDRLRGRPVSDGPGMAEVFGPCGGAGLYRSSLLQQVGLFDPAFFLYMEDADLAWRARWQGWRCLYLPQAKVHHYGSASAGEVSLSKLYYLQRNKYWVMIKNFPSSLLFRCLSQSLISVVRDGGAGRPGRYASRYSLRQLIPVYGRAFTHTVREMPRLLHERQAIQRERKVSISDIAYWVGCDARGDL